MQPDMQDVRIVRADRDLVVFCPPPPGSEPALVGLLQRAYRGEASREGWTSEADLIDGTRTSIEDMRAILADPGQAVLAAFDGMPADGGALVGCAVVSDEGGGAAGFGMFAVEPRLQAGGIGKRIMDSAEAEARGRFGAARMEMKVVRGREALVAFYARRGYRATGASVRMSDLHSAPDMTRGHDLILDAYEKPL